MTDALACALFFVADPPIFSAPVAVPWEGRARAAGKREHDKRRADDLPHCHSPPPGLSRKLIQPTIWVECLA